MPSKPRKPCNKPGCRELTTERYCEKHKPEQHQYDQHRGTAAERGYDHRWREYRKWYLQQNPLCRHCSDEGQVTPATVVDHIVPHKGNMELFWNPKNHQPLCKMHHDRKTATEDGGFGR